MMGIQFIIGQEYRRKWLHDNYGGSYQGGMTTSTRYPIIFLFTGPSGHQFGYHDGPQEDGTFRYTGMGQVGEMKMQGVNRAVLNAAEKDIALHLFEQTRKGIVRYMNSMCCIGYESRPAQDRTGAQRTVIVFLLRPIGYPEKAQAADLIIREPNSPIDSSWKLPLDELRQVALSVIPITLPVAQQTKLLRARSAQVKVYALRRANGICEACDQPAPFTTAKGTPYLEVHHIARMADYGPDHPSWVAAICPTCHRRIHYGNDGATYNEKVSDSILVKESNFSH